MRRIIIFSIVISLILAAFFTVVFSSVVDERWQIFKTAVDLTQVDQKTLLDGPWNLKPDQRFPSVMKAYDQGKPVAVSVVLPSQSDYLARFKCKFHTMDQQLRVRLNDTDLGTLQPSRAGEAEKFDLPVPASAVISGVNRIGFINRGSPGGTEYELVRLQNYRTVISKKGAYIVLAARTATASKHSQKNSPAPFFLVAGVIFITLLTTANIFLQLKPTHGNRRQLFATEFLACAPALLLASAALLSQSLAGYRLVCTPRFYWTAIGTSFLGGHIIASGFLLFRFLSDRLLALHLGESTIIVAQAGGRGFTFFVKRLGDFFCLAIQFCRKTARRIGPWFIRQQCPRGYARFFCYLAIITLLEHWVLGWESWAEVTACLAAVTLITAVFWESRLNPDEDD